MLLSFDLRLATNNYTLLAEQYVGICISPSCLTLARVSDPLPAKVSAETLQQFKRDSAVPRVFFEEHLLAT